MIFRKEINNRFAGKRLDVYLTEVFTYYTRNGWQKIIDEGRISLNGKKVKASTKILRESVLEYDLGELEEKPINTDYSVLFDDGHLFIINKPPNIPVHTSGKYFNNTLIKLLRKDFPQYDLNLINRLDRETSGIIVLGKTALARTVVGNQFRNKETSKTYIAYTFGEIPEKCFTVDAPIAEFVSPVVRIRMGINAERGLAARTDFSVIRKANGFTKLYCYPVTGRTNQIRVHLAHTGHPVVGDKLYSGNDADFLEFIEGGNTPEILSRVIMARHALHAHKLELTHPATGERMTITAPEPQDMVNFETSYMG